MKKYTGKILWMTAVAIALFFIIGITVVIQNEWKKYPEHFHRRETITQRGGRIDTISPDVITPYDEILTPENESY